MSKEITYRDFTSAQQLREYYGIQDKNGGNVIIREAKDDPDQKKKDDDATKKMGLKGEGDPATWGEEVVYAKGIKAYTNIFKKIIVLTNDRDPKKNKTLDNIYGAVENLKKDKCKIIPEVLVFVADETLADEKEDGSIHIEDTKTSIDITDESNCDTLVFSRLGVQNTACEQVTAILQDRGFLVLNPIRYSKLASNKYDTAVLLQKGGIPQPNFALMTKDILYDEEAYNNALKEIHPGEYGKSEDGDKELEYVVKILDGHGGTGVSLLTGKQLLANLQLLFAVDPELRLIIQAKEEADGGDIRVHVLTLRNKQRILAAMKRVKISGDFRSNVSLGATAEPVELTPAQEQIALRAARLSRLPWCAVDIMPLKKGSNKELGDNVVLELNASPGTDGISDVMDENFINLLLCELDDPNEFYIQEKTAGYEESVCLDLGDGPIKMLARLDTGNGSIAGHFEVGKFDNDGKRVKFTLFGKSYDFEKVGESNPIVGGEKYTRPLITIPEITLGKRKLKNIKMGVVESRNKGTNVLLNRDILSRMGYIVNPSLTHMLTSEMQKVKIL